MLRQWLSFRRHSAPTVRPLMLSSQRHGHVTATDGLSARGKRFYRQCAPLQWFDSLTHWRYSVRGDRPGEPPYPIPPPPDGAGHRRNRVAINGPQQEAPSLLDIRRIRRWRIMLGEKAEGLSFAEIERAKFGLA